MFAHIKQFVLDPLPLQYLVLEDVAIVLEEVDIPDIAIAHAEVHWLVALRVFYVLHHCHCFGLAPVPQSYRAIHVVTHHELGVKGRLGDTIQQGADPLRPPNSARLSRKHKLLPVGEEFDVICGRGYEIDVDWLLDADVMLDNCI